MNPLQLECDPATTAGTASLSSERGAALIIVLLLLLLLTILGSTVLTSSTTEVRLAGNYRNQQQAFFTAQGALEHAVIASLVHNSMSNVNDIWTGTITFNGNNIVVATGAVVAAGAQDTAQVTAEFVASGTPPRGSGASADTFVANYYDVDVVGMGPNNSSVDINSEVYVLQAKTD